MKILLQRKSDYHYLKEDGTWTLRVNEAKDWPRGGDAVDYCSEHKLGECQVVLMFNRSEYNITIPTDCF